MAVVKKEGYSVNPVFSKALSLARQAPGARYRETIAFILEYPTETGPDYQKAMHEAAIRRAAEMGYKLEAFVVSGKPTEHRRLERILKTRGIRGMIIIPRLEHLQPRLHFKWSELTAVEIGRMLWHPRNLHHVEPSDYHKIHEALHLLKKVGYRRIGMAIEPMQNHHQRGTYYASYTMSQLRQPESARIPVLGLSGPWGEASFRAWMLKYEPDVLVIHHAPEICGWLRNMKRKWPADISLFCVNAKDPLISGLVRDYPGLGRSAVEMLSLLLESGEFGLPDRPRSWVVDEYWQAGSSLARPIDEFLSETGGLLPAALAKMHTRVTK